MVYLAPYFFPTVGWFMAANLPDAQLYPHLSYQRQTNLNRTAIKGANKVQYLTVPVNSSGRGKPLSQTEICNKEKWANLHLRTLQSAYGKTAYFEHYKDAVFAVFTQPTSHLLQLNLSSIELCFRLLHQPPLATCESALTPLPALYQTENPTGKPYYQPFGEFIPNLSILDLLFNTGPSAALYLR